MLNKTHYIGNKYGCLTINNVIWEGSKDSLGRKLHILL